MPWQADGERLPLAVKDLGSCDLYPQSLQHNPNGRFVTVCGDGEYIIYTALAWRNKSFGTALEFVWAEDSSVFATRFALYSRDAFFCCTGCYIRARQSCHQHRYHMRQCCYMNHHACLSLPFICAWMYTASSNIYLLCLSLVHLLLCVS